MCAETVWWRCHRRIIADYLIAAGETVMHILANGRGELARITDAAVQGPNCTLVYPLASTIVGFHQDEEKGLGHCYLAVISSTFVIDRRLLSGHGS